MFFSQKKLLIIPLLTSLALIGCGGSGDSNAYSTNSAIGGQTETKAGRTEAANEKNTARAVRSFQAASSSVASSFATSSSNKDATPPTAPGQPTALLITHGKIYMEWAPSTDNIGVTSYSIYRNGVFHGSVDSTKTNFEDTNLTANTDYIYSVVARDEAGNQSLFSFRSIFKTLATDDGLDHMLWRTPNIRENGEPLALNEIQGYEIRYSVDGQTAQDTVLLTGNHFTRYSAPRGSMKSPVIAVIDTNGLYSRFTPLQIK